MFSYIFSPGIYKITVLLQKAVARWLLHIKRCLSGISTFPVQSSHMLPVRAVPSLLAIIQGEHIFVLHTLRRDSNW